MKKKPNKYFSLRSFLHYFGLLAIVLTLFPFIPIEYWVIRIFDFPHVQLTILTFLALITYFLRFNFKKLFDYFFAGALMACLLFQIAKIYPYTKLSKFEMQNATTQSASSIKLYSANVLQKNKDWKLLKDDIEHQNPDLLVFTETDTKWKERLFPYLAKKYRYNVEAVQDNTYGMLLYSRFPLQNTAVKFMVEDTIPSIHAEVELPNGSLIQVYAIHPAPPTPQHNPSSVDRDAEMIKIAQLSRKSDIPVIVLGDFNDVAWSETTALFQAVSGLLDMRKGRGLYNTYNAKNWLMRWPLDHIFSSAEFRFKTIALGPNFGSDHFPLFCELTYEPNGRDSQLLPPPSKEQLESAKKSIEDEKEDIPKSN